MIVVRLNEARFEYDIHSLVKAFYPAEDVKVFQEGTKDFESEDGMPEGRVVFEKDTLLFELYKKVNSEDDIFQSEGIIHERRVSEQNVHEEKIQKEKASEQNISEGKAFEGIIRESIAINEADERPEIKIKLKHIMYRCLSKYTGKLLPWGNLTGIRPTKIAYGLLEDGMSEGEIITYLEKTYDCSHEKAVLSIDIATREKKILSKLHYEDGYSIYIGIPFCPTTCLYCSFTSYPIGLWRKRVDEYLTALEKEIDYVSKEFNNKIFSFLSNKYKL